MRSIFGIFLVLLTAMPQVSAQLNSYSRSELAFDNALAGYNPGFESGTVKWTASGGTFAVNSGTQFVPGSKQFASWDSNSASQEVCSSLVKVPESGNCSVGLEYRVPSGTATHKIVAKDGSKDLAVEDVVSSTAAWRHDVEFPCAAAASNQARVCLRSVAANEPAIQLDGGYAGEARNVAQCGVDTPWVAYTPSLTTSGGGAITLNATSKTDPFGRWRRVGDSIEIEVGFKNGSGGAATGTAGTMQFSTPSGASIDSSKAVSTSAFAFTVGTGDVYPLSSNFSPSSAVLYNGGILQLIKAGTTLSFQVSDIVASFEVRMRAKYPVVGWTASQCVTPNQQGWWAAGYISGANADLGTASVSTYTEITNSSLTLTPDSGSAPIGIVCSSTNAAATPSTGATTCSAGSEGVGFATSVPRAGRYEVCMQFGHATASTATDAGMVTAFEIVNTATNSQTILNRMGPRSTSGHYNNPATSMSKFTNVTACGQATLSAGSNAFRLFYEQSSLGANAVSTNVIHADANASIGDRAIRVTMRPVTTENQAILANSVWTGATQMRIETVTIQNNGSACSTLGNLSSNWVGVYTRNGAGRCQFTMPSGVWSSTPTCQCTVQSTNAVSSCSVDSNITLSSTLMAFQSSAGGSAADSTMRVMCMEPR